MILPKIEVRAVAKSFRRAGRVAESQIDALQDVSFSIAAGEFVCLIGPSGCGKTTLLRLMNGLIEPDAGEIFVDGKAGPVPGPWAGFVFQSFRLLPWRTIADNVQFPLQMRGIDASVRAERAREYLALVGLDGFDQCYPHELSGGMQQRVGLARALALQPEILLMDEPFAALDAQTRELMQIELSRIWEQRKVAVVFVTHSLDESIFLADRIILLRRRPGKVEEEIPVPFERPRWRYDIRALPEYSRLRAHLWDKIRGMVADEPQYKRIFQESA